MRILRNMPRGVAARFCLYGGFLVIVVRRFVLSVLLVLSSVAAGVGLTPSAQAATVGLSAPQTGRIVNEDPANFTPHILNGTVYSIVQVGDYIVVGGSFTQVRSATSTTTITRNRVFAFNATTGVINPDFNPAPNGTVYKVQQSTDPGYVYVGGNFSTRRRRQPPQPVQDPGRRRPGRHRLPARRAPTARSATSRSSATTCSWPAR